MAERALRGVGDAQLGEWREQGGSMTFHLRRRVAEWEAKRYRLEARDVRGTPEHARRVAAVVRAVPNLAAVQHIEEAKTDG